MDLRPFCWDETISVVVSAFLSDPVDQIMDHSHASYEYQICDEKIFSILTPECPLSSHHLCDDHVVMMAFYATPRFG
jgi:hypothetical protein